MKTEFIPYESALELKELGFDEPCFGFFDRKDNDVLKFDICYENKNLSAPTFSQTFRWFREKYKLYAWTKYEFEDDKITPTYYIISPDYTDIPGGAFNTYEEAELACLNKLIEIVKNEKQ